MADSNLPLYGDSWWIRNIPAAARVYLGMLAGTKDPMTNKDFSREEIDAMHEAVGNATIPYITGRNQDTGSMETVYSPPWPGNANLVTYENYRGGAGQAYNNNRFLDIFRSPALSMMNTVGNATLEKTGETSYKLHDAYDFNPNINLNNFDQTPLQRAASYLGHGNLFGALRSVSEILAPDNAATSYVPRPITIDINMDDYKQRMRRAE